MKKAYQPSNPNVLFILQYVIHIVRSHSNFRVLGPTMALSTTGLVNTRVNFVFRHGKHLMYGYILANKIICEDLMKITQIFVEI